MVRKAKGYRREKGHKGDCNRKSTADRKSSKFAFIEIRHYSLIHDICNTCYTWNSKLCAQPFKNQWHCCIHCRTQQCAEAALHAFCTCSSSSRDPPQHTNGRLCIPWTIALLSVSVCWWIHKYLMTFINDQIEAPMRGFQGVRWFRFAIQHPLSDVLNLPLKGWLPKMINRCFAATFVFSKKASNDSK